MTSFGLAYGSDKIAGGMDAWIDDLDRILSRVLNADSVLSIYVNYPTGRVRSQDAQYTVVDLANGHRKMLPYTSKATCIRFALAYKNLHPQTQLDDTFGAFATTSGASGPAPTPPPGAPEHDPYSRRVDLSNVVALPVRAEGA